MTDGIGTEYMKLLLIKWAACHNIDLNGGDPNKGLMYFLHNLNEPSVTFSQQNFGYYMRWVKVDDVETTDDETTDDGDTDPQFLCDHRRYIDDCYILKNPADPSSVGSSVSLKSSDGYWMHLMGTHYRLVDRDASYYCAISIFVGIQCFEENASVCLGGLMQWDESNVCSTPEEWNPDDCDNMYGGSLIE
jgi:hypothetical protein